MLHVRENIYRSLAPSWRSELAERLRGQHTANNTRYYKEETAALSVAFSRAKIKASLTLVHGCTCTGYSSTHKGKKCAPAS